ncbi:unnamed protein product, partial [Prorocentrum cordatum]
MAGPVAAFEELATKVGKPATWAVGDASMAVSDGWKGIFYAFQATASENSAANEDLTPEMTMPRTVLDSAGKVSVRTGAGRKLTAEINEGIKEKDEHSKFAELTEKKYQEESTFDLQSVEAEYCASPRLVSREGGGTSDPIACDNGLTFSKNAIAKWRKGEAFHGHPWVKYCNMRNTAAILHYREKVSLGINKVHGLRKEWSEGASGSTEGGRPADPPAKRPNNSEGGAEPKVVEPAPKPSGDKEKKGKEDKTEESEKKRLSSAISKLKVLKSRYADANAFAADLFDLVSKDPVWAWANNEILLQGLRKAREDLDERKNASDFCKTWVADAEFTKNASKRFEAANIITPPPT